MELNNLENVIKEAMDERSLTPSNDARECLSNLLLQTPRNKNKISWQQWSIAASIVLGLFLIGAYNFINIGETIKPSQITNQNKKSENTLKEMLIEEELVKTDFKLNDSIDIASQIKNTTNISVNSKYTLTTKDNFNTNTEGGIQFDKRQANLSQMDSLRISEKRLLQDPLLASIILLDVSSNNYVTPEELISSIENDDSLQVKSTNQSEYTNYVNAIKLLTEMENQSFINKNQGVLHKVGKELKRMKEALANRNHE